MLNVVVYVIFIVLYVNSVNIKIETCSRIYLGKDEKNDI